MGEFDIANTIAGSSDNVIDDFSVDTADTDGTTSQKETEWQNVKWTQQYGYLQQ